jgi:hypothetical protein
MVDLGGSGRVMGCIGDSLALERDRFEHATASLEGRKSSASYTP